MKGLLIVLFIPCLGFAGYVDLSANVWQNRQLYGATNTSSNLSQTFSVGWAWFMWPKTALELMGQRQRSLITENDPVSLGGSDVVVSSRNEVLTDTLSVGIKQNLASSQASIVPAITFGYAKQILQGKTRYVVNDGTTTTSYILEEESNDQDSCFLGASLRFKITQFFGIMSSFRSIMPKCDTQKMSDNTQLTAGISWIF
jgi:hypothetical protein